MVAATRPFFRLFTGERRIRILELAVIEYEKDNERLRGIRDAVLAMHPIRSYYGHGWANNESVWRDGCPTCETFGPCATRQACAP